MTNTTNERRCDELFSAIRHLSPQAVLRSPAFSELCRQPAVARTLLDLADQYGWRVRAGSTPRREIEAILRVLLAEFLASMPATAMFDQVLAAAPGHLADQLRRQLAGRDDHALRTPRPHMRAAARLTALPSDEVIAKALGKSVAEVKAARDAWRRHGLKPMGFFDHAVAAGSDRACPHTTCPADTGRADAAESLRRTVRNAFLVES